MPGGNGKPSPDFATTNTASTSAEPPAGNSGSSTTHFYCVAHTCNGANNCRGSRQALPRVAAPFLILLVGNHWMRLILQRFLQSLPIHQSSSFGQQDASIYTPSLRGLASCHELWYPSRACKQCFC